MNRFHPFAAALLAAALSGALCAGAHAQAVYKWTDADGKVHYGDRAAAPQDSKQLDVPVAAPPPAAPAAGPANLQRRPPPATPRQSVPVDPARVGPACKGLIDRIAAVPAGQNWEGLYRQFDSACPGIAYECVEYASSPQNDRCVWVERSGSRVLNRKRYP